MGDFANQPMKFAFVCLLAGFVSAVSATSCDSCCLYGTFCSSAYNGQPGKCCSIVNSVAYCCPTSGSTYGDYTCVRSSYGYSCSQHKNTASVSGGVIGAIVAGVVVGIFICAFCAICSRRRRQYAVYNQPAYAQPVYAPQPTYTPQPAYAPGYVQTTYVQQPTYVQSGYSGSTVAAGTGAGFVGGLLVGEALSNQQHHHHHHGGFNTLPAATGNMNFLPASN
eukprot:c17500_g1_i1.p1 GENE.c17500_g1_i1~~c17500_g1_i1.p1  ORF type:complete len:222 (-),score=31.40 c17500_g1_i1:71-736(-)